MSVEFYGPESIRYPSGRPAAGEPIDVTLPNSNVKATLYTDATGMQAASNPVVTDSLGNLSFYAEDGEYDLVVRGTRIRIYLEPDIDVVSLPALPIDPVLLYQNAKA
jgi:hypothetical protein